MTDDQWGPFHGALLNISYGMGRIFLFPNEMVRGQLQGGVVQLPIPDFPTGMMRVRFHPGNGQLYVCGLVGWASNQHQDGGFYRIPGCTGHPANMPLELPRGTGGIPHHFSPDEIEAGLRAGPGNYSVKVWGLKRTENYGSQHYSEHPLGVTSATLAAGGKTIRLEIPDLAPTQGMEIKCSLHAMDGTAFSRTIHNTILALPMKWLCEVVM